MPRKRELLPLGQPSLVLRAQGDVAGEELLKALKVHVGHHEVDGGVVPGDELGPQELLAHDRRPRWIGGHVGNHRDPGAAAHIRVGRGVYDDLGFDGDAARLALHKEAGDTIVFNDRVAYPHRHENLDAGVEGQLGREVGDDVGRIGIAMTGFDAERLHPVVQLLGDAGQPAGQGDGGLAGDTATDDHRRAEVAAQAGEAVQEQGLHSQATRCDGREHAGETTAHYGHVYVVGNGYLLLWLCYVT